MTLSLLSKLKQLQLLCKKCAVYKQAALLTLQSTLGYRPCLKALQIESRAMLVWVYAGSWQDKCHSQSWNDHLVGCGGRPATDRQVLVQ